MTRKIWCTSTSVQAYLRSGLGNPPVLCSAPALKCRSVSKEWISGRSRSPIALAWLRVAIEGIRARGDSSVEGSPVSRRQADLMSFRSFGPRLSERRVRCESQPRGTHDQPRERVYGKVLATIVYCRPQRVIDAEIGALVQRKPSINACFMRYEAYSPGAARSTGEICDLSHVTSYVSITC